MFDISTIEVDNQKENIVLKKSINLDKNLDCFLMISSSSNSLAENLLNHSLESIIDKISKEETYNDFWIALENINSFLKNWRTDEEQEDELDMSIAVLNENNLMFSNIWKSTVYLINKNSEIIELTERDENKKYFLFIYSWILANSGIIISSTVNILKYLSKSDIIDWMILSNDIEIFNKNIKNILQSEIVEKNCIISSLKYKNEFVEEDNSKIEVVKDIAVKILDTEISKKILWKTLILKDKISNQNKTVKNILFFVFIIFLIFILYVIVGWLFNASTWTQEKEKAQVQISDVNVLITDASKNVSNPWIFNRNIEQAEAKIKELEAKNLYAKDIEKLKSEINLLKKQFNRIEIFSSGTNNLVYSSVSKDNERIIKTSWKTYIITKKWIIWPIVSGTTPKTYLYNSLWENENFIDAWFLWQDIYLLTNTWKIIKFNKNWVYSASPVSWQKTWEAIKNFDTYNSSLYALGQDNQLYKHQGLSTSFAKWNTLLKEADVKNLWDILSMAIDWWIYLLKKDLSMVKFFTSPYRVESLTLSKLPENYNLDEGKRVELKAWINLNYVYLFLNNKIFVFKPNTNDFKSTRNLTYIWQIEGGNEEILDFFVEKDWELFILNEKGIYKVKFVDSDDKLILQP